MDALRTASNPFKPMAILRDAFPGAPPDRVPAPAGDVYVPAARPTDVVAGLRAARLQAVQAQANRLAAMPNTSRATAQLAAKLVAEAHASNDPRQQLEIAVRLRGLAAIGWSGRPLDKDTTARLLTLTRRIAGVDGTIAGLAACGPTPALAEATGLRQALAGLEVLAGRQAEANMTDVGRQNWAAAVDEASRTTSLPRLAELTRTIDYLQYSFGRGIPVR